MKTRKIHKVIYSEIIPPSLIALAVLTFVVFTREFGRLVPSRFWGSSSHCFPKSSFSRFPSLS